MDRAAIAAVVVILVSAGASFFFALAETALFSLSKWQMRQLIEREPRFRGVINQLLAEPQDLLATIYRHLGIDPGHEMKDASGRPVPVLAEGRPIAELI